MFDPERCPCGRGQKTGACPGCLFGLALDPPPEPDLTGTALGPFEISRKLGEGGMGVVYEAVDTRPASPRFGHRVALKVLRASLDAPGHIEREAQALAALKHESIVFVYETGEHDGYQYFTMERIVGEPPRTPASSPRRAAEIVLSIARAAEVAHRHGVLHRDLKRGNVLVDGEGHVFVLDFGIATREGLLTGVAGTLEYMAPELLRDEPLAPSTMSDVWSAGVILYELLGGHLPFESPDPKELIRKITAEPPPPLRGVPEDLAAVCLRCLEKDPSRRYAGGGELAAELLRYLSGEPVIANPLGPVARLLRRSRRHPLLTAILGVLLVVTLYSAAATVYAAVVSTARDHAQQAAIRAADFASRRAADSVALQFDRYKAAVEDAGNDPRVARAVQGSAAGGASELCQSLLAGRRAPGSASFTAWALFDRDGRLLGRAPDSLPGTVGRSYAFRDYFRGVKAMEEEGRRAAYVSRAFHSEGDDEHVIAISYAVHDASDRWVGLLAAVLPTGPTLGSIVLDDSGSEALTASVLAPRDRERSPGVVDPDPIFLLHRTLRPGQARPARDDPPPADSTNGALMRVVPVRGTPFSLVVRVTVAGARP
jgi:serine/threonine-protein kinase